MFYQKRNSRDVKQNCGFLFDERLEWLHGDYYVITGRSMNESSNKKTWTENNDIEEYNIDTQFDWEWGD